MFVPHFVGFVHALALGTLHIGLKVCVHGCNKSFSIFAFSLLLCYIPIISFQICPTKMQMLHWSKISLCKFLFNVNIIFLMHISNSIICIKEHLYNGGCNLETFFPWNPSMTTKITNATINLIFIMSLEHGENIRW